MNALGLSRVVARGILMHRNRATFVAASLVAGSKFAFSVSSSSSSSETVKLTSRSSSSSPASSSASASSSTLPPTSILPVASPVHVVLYQYQACPYCNKVRAYLDYAKIPYVLVEVDPLLKSQLSWSKDYRKVPLAIVNGVVVKDSSVIIDHIESILAKSTPPQSASSSPAKQQQQQQQQQQLQWPRKAGDASAEEEIWRKWTDAVLVHLLTANIYRTPTEALESFDYMTARNFPAWSVIPAKYIGAAAMLAVAKKVKTKHNIVGDERQALLKATRQWIEEAGLGEDEEEIDENKNVKQSNSGSSSTSSSKKTIKKLFLGGNVSPNLGDLAVFGVVRSIADLQTGKDIFAADAAFLHWYQRMEKAVGNPSLEHRVFEGPSGGGVRT